MVRTRQSLGVALSFLPGFVRPRNVRRSSCDGFILIAVLVVLALLSSFAMASIIATRSMADSARQFRAGMRHEATMRSAAELIGYGFSC